MGRARIAARRESTPRPPLGFQYPKGNEQPPSDRAP
jgi:hypothetical protein